MAGAHRGVRYLDFDTPVAETESGRAFTIDEALLAMRWAELVRQRGYRLTISHCFLEADEVLEVHILACSKSIARLHKGSRVIWSTDCLGHMRPFATLADALLALAPLSMRDRRAMLRAQRPAWFDLLPWGGPDATRMGWLARIARKLKS